MFEKGLDSCGVLGGRAVQTSICEPGFVVGAVPAGRRGALWARPVLRPQRFIYSELKALIIKLSGHVYNACRP